MSDETKMWVYTAAMVTAVFIAVVLALSMFGVMRVRLSREGFEDVETAADELCGALAGMHGVPASVAERCAEHLESVSRDTCLLSCSPRDLCGYAPINHCLPRGSGRCDVTHEYVGANFSAYNDALPRFFAVKQGVCLELGISRALWVEARARTALVEVLLRFPRTILVPTLHDDARELDAEWSVDTAPEWVRLPYPSISVPPRAPAFDLVGAEDDLVRSEPAFFEFDTSTHPIGRRTHREMSRADFAAAIEKAVDARVPASPERLVVTLACKFSRDTSAHSGFRAYSRGAAGVLTSPFGPVHSEAEVVSVVTVLVLDLAGGGLVQEEREAVRYGSGVYRISRKWYPPASQLAFESQLVTGFRCFMGALDPRFLIDRVF